MPALSVPLMRGLALAINGVGLLTVSVTMSTPAPTAPPVVVPAAGAWGRPVLPAALVTVALPCDPQRPLPSRSLLPPQLRKSRPEFCMTMTRPTALSCLFLQMR